jgi:hypothetical protein
MNKKIAAVLGCLFLNLTLLPHLLFGDLESIPYYEAVTKIMAPLEYSGISSVTGQDAGLSVNFTNKTWTLHNAHHFDDQGEIILDKGVDGLCGQLSRFVYGKIKSLFPKELFDIKFSKVREKKFFFTPQATHIVILITDKQQHKEYVIDPTFKRYGRKEDFDDYVGFDNQDPTVFLESNRQQDKYFEVDYASPILIRGDYLITFSVESVNGKFDKNHFVLALAADYRSSTTSKYLYAFSYNEGHLQIDKDEELIKQLLSLNEAVGLISKLMEWFGALCQTSQTP